jgi:hypothetical protein
MIKTLCTALTGYVLLEECQIKNLGNNSWFSFFAGLIFCGDEHGLLLLLSEEKAGMRSGLIERSMQPTPHPT